MRAAPVVVPAILVEDALDLSLVDGDHMIQALTPERCDNSFAVTVLPG
jgi:hypothetical protein